VRINIITSSPASLQQQGQWDSTTDLKCQTPCAVSISSTLTPSDADVHLATPWIAYGHTESLQSAHKYTNQDPSTQRPQFLYGVLTTDQHLFTAPISEDLSKISLLVSPHPQSDVVLSQRWKLKPQLASITPDMEPTMALINEPACDPKAYFTPLTSQLARSIPVLTSSYTCSKFQPTFRPPHVVAATPFKLYIEQEWYTPFLPALEIDRPVVYVGPMHVLPDDLVWREWRDGGVRRVRLPRSPFIPVLAFGQRDTLISYLRHLIADPAALDWHFKRTLPEDHWACRVCQNFSDRQ
jgi:hypothetical protein